jgi:hypothetical protein
MGVSNQAITHNLMRRGIYNRIAPRVHSFCTILGFGRMRRLTKRMLRWTQHLTRLERSHQLQFRGPLWHLSKIQWINGVHLHIVCVFISRCVRYQTHTIPRWRRQRGPW